LFFAAVLLFVSELGKGQTLTAAIYVRKPKCIADIQIAGVVLLGPALFAVSGALYKNFPTYLLPVLLAGLAESY